MADKDRAEHRTVHPPLPFLPPPANTPKRSKNSSQNSKTSTPTSKTSNPPSAPSGQT
jgi:hypothetical protein